LRSLRFQGNYVTISEVRELTASPVLAGDKIFVTNEAGTTFVIRDSATFEQIAANGTKFKSVEDILEEIYRTQQK
jgi:hypothetical protein